MNSPGKIVVSAMDPELEVGSGAYISASNASNPQDLDPQSKAPAVLSANGLFKRYGPNIALHNTTFAIEEGEIVAVMGENGAGKSTLSKVLAGALRPDAGEIRVAGNVVHFSSPRDALRAGIAYVPQELEYLPALTVAENILLGQWRGRRPYTTKAEMVRRAGRIAAQFGVDIDVRARMAHIGLAERQLVEILKGLARQAKVVILDEPTASLTSEESANLFGILTRFTASGVAFVYISHRLDEIFKITDRLLVMRNGRIVADRPTGATTPRQLIDLMLGVEVAEAERSREEPKPRGRVVLKVEDWARPGIPNIANLTFDVHEGEVVGLFGPRGSGADIVADALGGRIGGFTGLLEINGKRRKPFSSPRDARSEKVGYIPAERKIDGLNLQLSVAANLNMLLFRERSQAGFVNRRAEKQVAQEWADKLKIRCQSTSQAVGALSGGNQQKVLLGSRLVTEPRLLVLNEPTRGVDIGTRAEIHRLLREQAAQGTSVLWVTTDVEEAVLVSDRMLVMNSGRIVGELTGTSITQKAALEMATDSGR